MPKTGATLNTHRHSAADTLSPNSDHPSDAIAPPLGMPSFASVVHYGRRVVLLDEDGDDSVMAEGHDRTALAAINAHGRRRFGPRWALTEWPCPVPGSWGRRPMDITWLWVLFRETCGCTDDQHDRHLAAVDVDPCPCRYPGLPPCEDRFAWAAVPVPTDTPGALAVTQVLR
jgi:hypothetical protein